MMLMNKENLIGKRKRTIYVSNNNLEIYFEEKNNTLNDIYLKCRKCLDKNKQTYLHIQQEKACLRFSSPFHKLGILLVLMFLLSLGATSSVSNTITASRGRWCQKVLKEYRTREVTDTRLCSEKYNTSCGFFSFDTCVFTRSKICSRTYNKTFVISKSVLDCCPGWEKSNNDTCVEMAVKPKTLPSIHELSVGTFAAICSAGAFIMVIVFFIIKAVWKKKRKEKAAVENIYLEQLESLNILRPQQVPLIPPQPMMANPSALFPLKSPVSDKPEPEAAVAETTVVTVPVEENQKEIGMEILKKIPDTEEMAAAAAHADATPPDATPPESAENLSVSDPPELKVELFIREEGDVPKMESHTQNQALPENSETESPELQSDPKA